jgi:hypothetical protein
MKTFNLLCGILIGISVFTSCSSDDDQNSIISQPLEPYLLSRLDSIPCDSPFFIKIIFQDSVINYLSSDSNIVLDSISGTSFGNLNSKGFNLRDTSSDQRADISFYKEEVDSTFTFDVANYRFAESINGTIISGANIGYTVPTGIPSTRYFYNGSNDSSDSYFNVTWIDENHICGQFKTILKPCCSAQPMLPVEGEFSIPIVSF